MINNNSVKYSNFAGILSSPSSFVPSLSDSEKFRIIIDSISAYIDNEIGFSTFIDLVTKMKFFSGLTDKTDYVNEALIKLVHLSDYTANEKLKKDDINTILVNVLDGFAKKH